MKKILSLILVAIMFVTAMPMAFAADTTYKVGDIIQFGSYPQSKVTDNKLITVLNLKAPNWKKWTSYGYYSGSGDYGTMKQGDWMRYTDVTYNGNKYRGVKFTEYRPEGTITSPYDDPYYLLGQLTYGYLVDTVYWFKFEPINWRVLDPSTGLVMSEIVIDAQPYSNTIYYNSNVSNSQYAYFNDASYTNYACDYKTSSIRKWLNDDFYNIAFSDSEKNKINTTTINDSDDYVWSGYLGYENSKSNEVTDKIFLLSYDEVKNSNYGFDSSSYTKDTARKADGSDYAMSQGANRSSENYGLPKYYYWLLRTPYNKSDCCRYVEYDGRSDSYIGVAYSFGGIRPALKINLVSDTDQSIETPEKELNFFQKIIQWFKNLFAKLFGWIKK